jgi:mitogen-activated protein kinase 15
MQEVFKILRIIKKMSEEVEQHILKKYNIVKKLGSGAYGHVWKVTDRKTGQIMALKKIFDAFQHSTDAQRTFREIVFLHELNHPNIVKLYNVFRAENDKDLYLVFEFMEADLHNAIGQKILKDIHNRFIMYQVMKAIKFLHSAQIIHRDLKPSNLLINSDCLLKICDFGLARSLVSDREGTDMVLTEEVATRWYRAPEVLLGSQTYDKSADIWSIGCILGEIINGKPMFPGNSTLNQL